VTRWRLTWKADPAARRLADRHYNRQHVGADQFCPPGRTCVLISHDSRALWVTSWPFAEYVRHAWAGAWTCSIFRNEGTELSSTLIASAVAATRAVMGESPPLGFVTFVDEAKTRRKRDPGRCYLRAGWRRLPERTAGGLVVLQQLPHEMPEAVAPLRTQRELFA
jgi:hypothetical protein